MAGAYNQIEGWFAEITRHESTVAHFASVRDLIKAIKDYVRHYNANPGRFQWVAITPNAMNPAARQRRGTSDVAA